MNLKWIITLLLGITLINSSRADSPRTPVAWVTSSKDRSHIFKMIPPKWAIIGNKSIVEREPFGVAYELDNDGELKEIWRSHGWYTFQGYLSHEGRYFVRFGPWASDQENHTDLAIAFYDQGRLLKQYEVRELIKEPDKLEDSVSHYMWSPEKQTKPNGFYNDVFHLVMVDKTTYDFDFKTGEIKVTGRDALAKSSFEIQNERYEEGRRKGTELLEASPCKKALAAHFEIDHIEAVAGSYGSCSLDGPFCSAYLTPKKKLQFPAGVEAVFPIKEDRYLGVKLTPADIVSAIEKVFTHSYVKRQFESGSGTGVRLRTQGDRLHWDTPELFEFLEKTTGDKLIDNQAAHWAYFIIDTKEREFISFYFNTKTEEIIAEDRSKWPHVPFLIGARGENMPPMQSSAVKKLLPPVIE